MFKNPIKKYQSGGVTPEQARQQVVQFIIQKTGATEDQVNGFLDKIAGDEKALGEFQQILELASKDDPKGIDMLKQLFGTQSSQFAKKGGKLHAFICKHTKGGVAGCGCKEDGGKVEKAQLGTTAPTYLYDENGYPVEMNERTSRDGRVLIQETPTSVGEAMHLFNSLSANADGYAFPIEYNMQRLHMLGDGAMSVQPIRGFERDLESQKINRWKTSNTQPNPDAKENGGVVKGQGGEQVPYGIKDYRNFDGTGRTYQWYDGSPITKMYLKTNTRFDPVTKLHHTDSSFTHFFLPEDVLGSMDRADKKSGIWYIKDSDKYKNTNEVVPFLRKKWEALTKGYKK